MKVCNVIGNSEKPLYPKSGYSVVSLGVNEANSIGSSWEAGQAKRGEGNSVFH